MKLENVFVVAQEANLNAGVFMDISGEGKAWVSAIDDSGAGDHDYLPVFEAAAIGILAAMKADEAAIRAVYDSIAANPMTAEDFANLLTQRLIHILPKTGRFNAQELKDLYRRVAEEVWAAA